MWPAPLSSPQTAKRRTPGHVVTTIAFHYQRLEVAARLCCVLVSHPASLSAADTAHCEWARVSRVDDVTWGRWLDCLLSDLTYGINTHNATTRTPRGWSDELLRVGCSMNRRRVFHCCSANYFEQSRLRRVIGRCQGVWSYVRLSDGYYWSTSQQVITILNSFLSSLYMLHFWISLFHE